MVVLVVVNFCLVLEMINEVRVTSVTVSLSLQGPHSNKKKSLCFSCFSPVKKFVRETDFKKEEDLTANIAIILYL